MARDRITFTDEEIKRIETMAGVGLNVTQMAAILGVSKATFDRRIADTPEANESLEKGRALAALNIMQTAYKMAQSGKTPAMTMFWLKCRQGWKETFAHELSGPDGKPIETEDKTKLTKEQRIERIQAMLSKVKKDVE